jgi:hypothetical protein
MADRVSQARKVQDELLEIFRKKNSDYGDAFADYGPVGVLVRMGDKIRRVQSITSSGIVLVDDEKLRDTLLDLANYSIMAVMLLDEKSSKILSDQEKESDYLEPGSLTGSPTLMILDETLSSLEDHQDPKLTQDFLNITDY